MFMKIIIMTMIFMIMTPILSFSSIPVTYIVDIPSGTCGISLYTDGKYEMIINQWYGDIGAGFTISSGKYRIKNNSLVLIDSYNQFEMKFISKNGYLITEKSYLFAKDFKFKFSNSSTDLVSTFSDIPNAIEIAREKFSNKKEVKYNLQFGKYIGEGGLYSWCFKINTNHSFELKVEDIVLLAGTWERKGNELRLFDTTLKHTFYVFIAKNKLINYVFNELIGSEFIIEKTKEKAKTKKKSKK
jgi:hypothetical protein